MSLPTGQLSFSHIRTVMGGDPNVSISISFYYQNASTEYTIAALNIPTQGNPLSVSHFRGKVKNPGGLDQEVAIPFTAYSMRLLYQTYTGPTLRVRRGDTNVEADVYFTRLGGVWKLQNLSTLVFTYGSSALSNFKGSSTLYVVRWYDQRGTGFNMIQSTTNVQPTLDANGVLFNAQRLQASFTGTVTNFTFIGCAEINYGSAAGYFGIETLDGNVFDTLVYQEGTTGLRHGTDNLLRSYAGTATVSGKKSITMHFGANTQRLTVNNVSYLTNTSFTPVTYTNQRFHMGYRHANTIGPLSNSRIYEVLYFTSVLSDVNRSSLVQNQMTGFNVS